jgi:hypothetical protein
MAMSHGIHFLLSEAGCLKADVITLAAQLTVLRRCDKTEA